MNKSKIINLLLEIDYYNKDVKSKISWDKDDFVSYTKTMSEIEMKVFKKMITSELKPVTDYLNPVKVKKPKLVQETRSESAKDKLIKVLQTENAQLKAEIVELMATNAELMAMNKALLARLDLK